MQFDYVVLFKFGVAIDFMTHKNQWDLKSERQTWCETSWRAIFK